MDGSWKVKKPSKGSKAESKVFSVQGHMWKMIVSNTNGMIYLGLEYQGGSYHDLMTMFYFDVDGTRTKHLYQFSMFNTDIGMYIEEKDEYVIKIDLNVRTGYYNSKEETGYVGLRNLGATCYINSLMQSLFNIKKFRGDVFGLEAHGRTLLLQRLFKRMQNDDYPVDTTEFVVNNVWVDSVHSHQDIHEFSKVFFDLLEKDSKRKDFIEDLIQGELSTYIKGSCGCVRRIKEKFQDIQVEIRDFFNKKLSSNLEESLRQYTKSEVLDGNNKYNCEEHGLVDAEKGVMFSSLPPVLFVLLKRFNVDFESGEGYKINDHFEFHSTIDMSDFMDDKNGDDVYDLYSVIVHRGDHNEGHFYAYLKINDRWLKFNDTVVVEVHSTEALENNFGGRHAYKDKTRDHSAYYLIYLKKSMINELLNVEVNIPIKTEEILNKEHRKVNIKCVRVDQVRNYRGIGFYNVDSYDYPLSNYIEFNMKEGDSIRMLRNNVEKHLNTRKMFHLFECVSSEECDDGDDESCKRIKECGIVEGNGDEMMNMKRNYQKRVSLVDDGTINVNADYFIYTCYPEVDFESNRLIFLKVFNDIPWCEDTLPTSLRLCTCVHLNGTFEDNREIIIEKTGIDDFVIFREFDTSSPVDRESEVMRIPQGDVLIAVKKENVSEFRDFIDNLYRRICVNVSCGPHRFTIFVQRGLSHSDLEHRIQTFVGSKSIFLKKEVVTDSSEFKTAAEDFIQSDLESDIGGHLPTKNSVSCLLSPGYQIVYLSFCGREVDYNSISHLHIFVIENGTAVLELIKKVLVSHFVCLSPVRGHSLKELRMVDTVKDTLYLKSFGMDEEFTSNGMCVIQPFTGRAIKIAYYTGMYNVMGFPFFLQTDVETIEEFRSAHKVFEKMVMFDGKGYVDLELDYPMTRFNDECFLLIERT